MAKDLERERLWREANREMLLAYHREYYRKNKEAQLAAARENYYKNHEAKKAYARRKFAENPSAPRQWHQNNPDKYYEMVRVGTQKRRAWKMNAPGDGVTPKQWAAIKESYGNRCAYCASVVRLTMDHIEPLSKGGAHDMLNVVPACQRCNSQKHNNSIVLWLAKRAAVA